MDTKKNGTFFIMFARFEEDACGMNGRARF